ncbi:MAG: preprotein translocase subunit SecG [Clostridiales bacterium]|nr:preprotein translocase subunit SecG [Clostridiales bacterium]
MLNFLAFAVATADIVAGIRIALAALALICTGFIIFVVMKQSGNSDGTEAFTGSSSRSDESETYYGKNAGSRKEARLKLWTYIASGVLALCCIVMLILQAVL